MDAPQNFPPPGRGEPPITPEQSRQRASAVMVAIGLAQILPLILSVLPLELAAGLDDRRAWLTAVAAGGAIYVLTALPLRFDIRPAAWLAIAAAAAQAIVFILLALLAIVAAFSAGSPASMTMGVLLFGTVASMHLFIARWIWPGLWRQAA